MSTTVQVSDTGGTPTIEAKLSVVGPLQVSIVSPYGSVFEGNAVRVQAPGADGGLEIRARHAPMIASMATGAVVLTLLNDEQLTYAISGGFIEVLGDVVTILGETAEPASEIDLERAREAEARARGRLAERASGLDRRRAEQALERARNRTRIGMARVGQQLSA